MRVLLVAAALGWGCLGIPALAASDADCQALWKNADRNGDGFLSDAEATRYAAALRLQDRTVPSDGRIASAAFLDACKADVFTTRKLDAGAPLKGANSFTEGQARDRAIAFGIGDISAMSKDDDGIWRGKGSLDGKSVSVAVDYKGNVVTQ
jgi:hypothetical protein